MPYDQISLPPLPSLEPVLGHLANVSMVKRRRILHKEMPEPRPRHLYRFYELTTSRCTRDGAPPFSEFSVNRLRSVIVESVLRLSSPDTFNDPFDMRATVDMEGTLQEREARNRASIASAFPDARPREREARLRDFMSTPAEVMGRRILSGMQRAASIFGVCCFSAGDPRDVLMWSHYARDHAGVCLQFRVAMDPRILSRTVEVAYADEYPVIRYFKSFYGDIEPLLLRKHTRWQYEREVRILHPDGAGKYFAFAPAALTSIIIGCRADEAADTVIRNLLSERRGRGYSEVSVYRARRDPKRYELNFARVRDFLPAPA